MMERTNQKAKKQIYLIVALILAAAVICGAAFLIFRQSGRPGKSALAEEKVREALAALDIRQTFENVALDGDGSSSGSKAEASSPEPESGEEKEPYVSPIDFPMLQGANPDIYGWLYIPGTEISHPLLQREGDDEYYLSRNSDGQQDIDGAIFSQATYNHKDLQDPVTVVYGHHMNSGAMFGTLQETYSQEGALERYGDVIVYLPEEEMHYKVFAAVPANKIHILHYYDFSDPDIYQLFLDRIYQIRAMGTNFNSEIKVTPEDKMLILSTCLSGNSNKRYLVLAKRT